MSAKGQKNYTEEELLKASNRISAGRIKLVEDYVPYYSHGISSITAFAHPNQTNLFSISKGWVLSYSPDVPLNHSIEELASLWLHCFEHVLRDHGNRYLRAVAKPLEETQWLWENLADEVINAELKKMGLPIPKLIEADQNILQHLNIAKKDLLSSALETLLLDAIQKFGGERDNENITEGTPDQTDTTSNPEQGDENVQEKTQAENNSEKGDNEEGDPIDPQADKNTPPIEQVPNEDKQGEIGNPSNTGEPSQDQDSPATSNSTAEEGEQNDGASNESASGANGNSATPSDSNANSGDQDDNTDTQQNIREVMPDSYHECGSGASHDDNESASVEDRELSEDTTNDIVKQMLEDMESNGISRSSQGRNNIIEIKDNRKPVVSWERMLGKKLRQKVGNKFGRLDYSFKRRSRRHAKSKIIYPSLVGPTEANIFIIIDTSGSMRPRDISRAFAEIRKLMKRVRCTVFIVSCDAKATEIQELKKAENIVLTGGGGTDLRRGVDKVIEHKKPADVILFLTDGGTPWYTNHPPRLRSTYFMAVLIRDTNAPSGSVPPYIDTIVVPPNDSNLKIRI